MGDDEPACSVPVPITIDDVLSSPMKSSPLHGILLSNVVGCAPDEVTVAVSVSVTWEPLTDGRHLPLFAPRGAE